MTTCSDDGHSADQHPGQATPKKTSAHPEDPQTSDETDLPRKKRKIASTAEQNQPPPKKRNTSPTPEPEGTTLEHDKAPEKHGPITGMEEQALGSNGQGGDSESERVVEEDLRASMSAKTVTEKEGTPEHFQG